MNYWVSCALIFLFSFCSLSYELFLAKILGDLSQNEVLSQSMGIGLFLLGLGVGAALCSRKESARPLERLFRAECLLVALVFVALLVAYGIGFLQLLVSQGPAGWSVFVALAIMIFLIGALSGFELPLMVQAQGPGGISHVALAFSYFGGLAAGFAVPLVLNPGWGPVFALQILALGNFALVLTLLFFMDFRRALRPALLAQLLVPTAAMFAGTRWAGEFEQAYLKAFYFQLRTPDLSTPVVRNIWLGLKDIPAVERYHSPYQKIDFVRSSPRSAWAKDPSEGVALYLDCHLQFGESTLRIYHESMVHGSFNLAGRVPKSVLILGGGDGLIATELLKNPAIETIDLVEIDPLMIELGRTHPDMTRLNRGSLDDPKVRVHVDDGFSYLRGLPAGSVEAVFVDFPYPHSPDLLRLYSVEFYRLLERSLAPNAFAIMDGPIFSDAELAERGASTKPHELIARTVRAAGFRSLFAFGPYEGFFFFMKESRPLAFDYAKLSSEISNPALVNMKALNHALSDDRSGPVNSIFRPVPVLSPGL